MCIKHVIPPVLMQYNMRVFNRLLVLQKIMSVREKGPVRSLVTYSFRPVRLR